MRKKYAVREGSGISRSAEMISRDAAMRGDKAFKLAMLHARRWEREKFTLGVDTRHGTEQPTYVGLRALPPPSSSAISEF